MRPTAAGSFFAQAKKMTVREVRFIDSLGVILLKVLINEISK